MKRQDKAVEYCCEEACMGVEVEKRSPRLIVEGTGVIFDWQYQAHDNESLR
jgi:hypothetical protein